MDEVILVAANSKLG